MRRALVRVVALLLSLGLAGCAGSRATAARTLVVISLDGFRHDYPQKTATPALDRMARQGARGLRWLPPFPSQTFPSHATMATGVRPGRHGILNSAFRDPERGKYFNNPQVSWYELSPLWIWAKEQGLRSFVFDWIASSGTFKGVEADYWRDYDDSVTDKTRTETLIGWLKLPPLKRPNLAMVYMKGCDGPGHNHGPESRQVLACIMEHDRLLGQVLAAAATLRDSDQEITLLVTSDHGMTPTLGEINAGLALRQKGIKAEVLSTGPAANVYLPPGANLEQALEAARTIPHTTAYSRETLPEQYGYLHPTRTGQLVLVARSGYRFTDKLPAVVNPPTVAGHHGHPADQNDMPGILYLWGSAVKAGGAIPTAQALDLVPTACHIMGIPAPPHARGKVLKALLKR